MANNPKQAIKQAPVATLTTIESVVGFVLTFLVAHGVIGSIDVSATAQTIAPFIALVLPAIFGSAKWRLVSPVEKVNELVERDGVVSDADIARIDTMLDDKMAARSRQHDTGVALAGPRNLPRPRGMAAGQPAESGAA